MSEDDFIASLKEMDIEEISPSALAKGLRNVTSKVVSPLEEYLGDPAIRAYLRGRLTPAYIYLDKIRTLDSDERELLPMVKTSTTTASVVGGEIEEDFRRARENAKKIADISVNAAENLADLSKSYDSPRGYEALCGLINTAVNSNKEIVLLHEIKKRTTEGMDPTSVKNETNNTAVFLGNSVQLNKFASQIAAVLGDKNGGFEKV